MEETKELRRPGVGGFKSAAAWVAIVALLVLVAWLASERNARSWYLVPDEGRLVVMKGMMAPVGRRAVESAEPALAQAYAPLVPPPGKPLPAERAFTERSLLDQAMYDLLAAWAREEIDSGEPGRLDRGLGYLSRAEKLPGVSSAQRDDLAALRAESGYQEAIRLARRALEDLRDASEKLRVAAASRSRHATEAGVLLGPVDSALSSVREAVRSSSPPAAKPAPSADTGSQTEQPKQPQPVQGR